jgi:hypothetical protein
LEDIFSFQELASKVNGIQVPFTIGIQMPIQCQSMFSCGHNGVISMDATSSTDDMKFHLFILMGFSVHHTCSFSIDHYKSINSSGFAQMVKTFKIKDVVMHAQLETISFHY